MIALKQTIKGGFKDSHLRLNDGLFNLEKRNEEEIVKRANELSKKALYIWEYPQISENEVSEFMGKDKIEIYTTMDHYAVMNPEINDIYEELDRKIMSLDSGIRKEYKQQYIAYKVDTNFVNIKISKNELTIGLNITFEEILDPQGICRDTTNTGNFANNDVLFKVAVDTDINYVIELTMQALIYQMED